MSVSAARPSPEFLATIQPIVLVGGKSTRFGRDKLREPIGDTGEPLVRRPISALRAVFGPRVKLVGECHPGVASLADGVLPDAYPGVGPIGGIVASLLAWGGPVFVLAGDMPGVSAIEVRKMVVVAETAGGWIAVLAVSDRVHPCAGIYSQASLPILSDCLKRGEYRLSAALPTGSWTPAIVPRGFTANINLRDDLP
jgi:molybdopterin-guanine dinucleotide biosynthesis protein A